TADDAWEFLCLGFNALRVTHPDQLFKRRGITYEQLRDCKITVHDAVDSLPKALNEFGRRVCLTKAGSKRSLSIVDMTDAAKKTVHEKIEEYGKQFPRLQKMLISKPELRMVLAAVYRRKIGTILNCEDIYRDCCEELTQDQFEHALQALVGGEIITQTGRN